MQACPRNTFSCMVAAANTCFTFCLGPLAQGNSKIPGPILFLIFVGMATTKQHYLVTAVNLSWETLVIPMDYHLQENQQWSAPNRVLKLRPHKHGTALPRKLDRNDRCRDFIQKNYTPYEGDAEFLAGPTEKTLRVWDTLSNTYLKEERERRVYDIDTHIPADVDAFAAGYISGTTTSSSDYKPTFR